MLNGSWDRGCVMLPVSVIILHVLSSSACGSPVGISADIITVKKDTTNKPIKNIMPRIVKFIKEFSAKYETMIKGAKRKAIYNI